MKETEVRVRFAPSPTGYLHIGGARTALYNWLLARHSGGKFLLRIEDTDRNRYVPDALTDIMASLRWLGLDWDEGPEVGGEYGPYSQSERLDLYKKHAEQLIAEGKAYRCYCTAERLDKLRKEQEAAKQPSGYDRFCLHLSDEQRRELETQGARSVVRFRIPEGRTTVYDQLRGELEFDNNTIDDFVLLKSDGFPTYHLANIIDDHLMKITHVMRGDEWLVSTPRHVLLYQAFGWEPPQFAHLPIFLAPGGGKLSKRHGATSVKEYREKGYLPEALFNFLLLLGWNPGTDQEMFTLEEAAKVFSIDRINKSPVAFSTEKLDWFNGVYIRSLSAEDLARRCLPYLQQANLIPNPCPENTYHYLVRLMPLLRERLKSIPDIVDLASYFLLEEIPAPTKELLIPKKMDENTSLQVLEGALEALKKVDSDFTEHRLETVARGLAENLNLHDGQVFMPLRVAISGRTATPGLFETMHALGKERVLRRINNSIKVFNVIDEKIDFNNFNKILSDKNKRIRFINSNTIERILLIDFSNISKQELSNVIYEAEIIIQEQSTNSLSIIIDINDIQLNLEMIEKLKEFISFCNLHIEKAAIVGLNKMSNNLIMQLNKSFNLFENTNSAIKWLSDDN